MEMDDGCGRRKKYVRGIVSGRTYMTTVVTEKHNNELRELSPMTIPPLLAHRGFGVPTKGMRRQGQQRPFQTRNI
jgi:hypothetical protein